MNRKLVLFDFDGTLTQKDSLLEFIAYYKGRRQLYLGFLVNIYRVFRYYLGKLTNTQLKEDILSHFFEGEPIERFNKAGDDFATHVIPSILKSNALKTIDQYRKNGHRIIIVTASCSNWIRAWTDNLGLELIATELEVSDGKITGKIRGNNCYGPEKVARIRSYVDVDEYDEIIAYGDSAGDKQMLDMADASNYRSI